MTGDEDDEYPPDHLDPYTRMTVAQMQAEGERAEAEADDPTAWEPVEVVIDPNVRSVVSIRLKPGEIGVIEQAAAAAGMKLATFIRHAALAASGNAAGVPAELDADIRTILDAAERIGRTRRLGATG